MNIPPYRNGVSGARAMLLSIKEMAAPAPAQSVRYFRVTFPEPGKILLKVGPGDHSVQIFELTKDDLRGLVRDAIPQLL